MKIPTVIHMLKRLTKLEKIKRNFILRKKLAHLEKTIAVQESITVRIKKHFSGKLLKKDSPQRNILLKTIEALQRERTTNEKLLDEIKIVCTSFFYTDTHGYDKTGKKKLSSWKHYWQTI